MTDWVYKKVENLIKIRNPNFKIERTIGLSVVLRLVGSFLTYYLRGFLYRITNRIKSSGKVYVYQGVQITGASIILGKQTIIENHVRFKSLTSSIIFGEKCRIGMYGDIQTGSLFHDPVGFINIGDNVALGAFAHLGGAGGITIGADTIIGQYLSVHSENHNFDSKSELIRKQGVSRKGITIGSNCWIGSKVTFLDGSSIGDNCVVAAGAVVTRPFGDDVLIGGVPARIIKKI